ncbi:MAG: preprotein translocase subunit SecY [Candidatus Paceibacterota bacterium]
MQTFFTKIRLIFEDTTLRGKVLFTLGILILFRILATIPIPGIDARQLENLFSNNQFLGLLNIFSGGGLANLSIVMLGLGPYITASIIMQLMTVMSPKVKQLYHEEGDAGRRKFGQYTRTLTVPLAFIQSFGFLTLLSNQGVVQGLGTFDTVTNVIVITAGSLLLMWLGELITEYGVGNGVSLLIFAGIIAALPGAVGDLYQTFDTTQLPMYIGFAIAAFAVILAVVIVTEAERPVPITYAKQVRGMKTYGGVSTYLPLRLNQAGVIPIIFALSILLFPQMIFNFLAGVNNLFIANIAQQGLELMEIGWLYAAFYFLLVIGFTYFYTAITFDPDKIATNLQKSGAFVPGIRPGQATAQYVGSIVTRLTLVSAMFLGVVAVLPLALQSATGNPMFAIGGTALLIVVSVVVDMVKRMDAQVSIRQY